MTGDETAFTDAMFNQPTSDIRAVKPRWTGSGHSSREGYGFWPCVSGEETVIVAYDAIGAGEETLIKSDSIGQCRLYRTIELVALLAKSL